MCVHMEVCLTLRLMSWSIRRRDHCRWQIMIFRNGLVDTESFLICWHNPDTLWYKAKRHQCSYFQWQFSDLSHFTLILFPNTHLHTPLLKHTHLEIYVFKQKTRGEKSASTAAKRQPLKSKKKGLDKLRMFISSFKTGEGEKRMRLRKG